MLQLLNGSEIHRHSYSFLMTDSSQVGEVRRFSNGLCSALNFDENRKGKVSIVVNELGNNLVRYAKAGRMLVRVVRAKGSEGIEILALDSGPGLDEERAMLDGYTTGATPGTGMGAISRQSDEFDVYSHREKGTAIVSRIFSSTVEAEAYGDFEVGAVSIPLAGETVCGDAWTVDETGPDLNALVVDGLGHGRSANIAALEAVDVFENTEVGSLSQMLTNIHGRLKSTRGAAAFLLKAKVDSIEYAGVGNIRALIQTPGNMKSLISQNGTVGMQIRSARVQTQDWNGHGYLILHSDGLMARWDLSQYPGIFGKHPSILAGVLFRDFQRGGDDVTVVVIRRRH
ncbi:MAG: ATP-binding SpoIIE family protein phosphatase [Oligoflexales bacterium]